MFDALKNLGSLPGLMAKAREMQDKMKAMQEELARRHVTADAGGGMVEATVNGRLELVKLKIDKSRVDPNDTEMLEDLVVAAVQRGPDQGGRDGPGRDAEDGGGPGPAAGDVAAAVSRSAPLPFGVHRCSSLSIAIHPSAFA